MPDREKVINDLNVAKNILCHPQMLTPEMCVRIGQTITSAIAILKEQEAVPVDNGKCPSCNWDFENGELDFSNINESRFYCPRCGQAVKFEILH